MAGTASGHLLIADISGYTRYLTTSELEHAQGVLSSLMELLIDRTLPPLRVAGLEGDAVFSYGIAGGALGGQTLVEMIEDTYVSFRRAIEQMVMNTTCKCNACANISTLDLKFFVHHGTFSVSPLRGKDELVGPAVIEVHRLLKNQITESTGIRAYTAYTTQAVAALGLDGFTTSLTEHAETYPDLGTITLWVQDMHPVWETRRDEMRIGISPDDVLVRIEGELPVPLAAAWEVLLQPRYRALLLHVQRQEAGGLEEGRITDGSVFTCYHGTRITTQTVIAWHPLERMITEDTTPVPGARVLFELALQPNGVDTTLTILCSRARGSWLARTVCDVVGRPILRSALTRGLAQLRHTIEQELADGTLHIPDRNDAVAGDVDGAVSSSLTQDG